METMTTSGGTANATGTWWSPYTPAYYYPIYQDDGFKEWMRGFLEGKSKLSRDEVTILKEKLGMV